MATARSKLRVILALLWILMAIAGLISSFLILYFFINLPDIGHLVTLMELLGFNRLF